MRKTDASLLSAENALIPYSISSGYDDGSGCSTGCYNAQEALEGLTVREAFAAYTLAAASGLAMPAMAAQPVTLRMAAASSAGQSKTSTASPSPAGVAGVSSNYTWVLGVTVTNNRVTGGFWDANKLIPYEDPNSTDCNMCWAASSSNMIGWWQYYYGVPYSIDVSVARSAQDIFEVFKANWENDGGFTDAGCQWWLTGGDISLKYLSFLFNQKSGASGGGYYSDLYSMWDVDELCYNYTVKGHGAYSVAKDMVNQLKRGCILGLGIADPDDSDSGHALTLWGIARDSEGAITELHFTDSNDIDHGKRVIVGKVVYNADEEAYQFTNTDYKGYILEDVDVLEPFNHESSVKPSGLSARQSNKKAVFSWKANQRSGMTYVLGYSLVGESDYTYVKTSAKSLTLELPKAGTYKWAVRTMKGGEYITSWTWGDTLGYDATPPKVTLGGPYLKKYTKGRTKVQFLWSADEWVTYKLALDGKVVYTGRATSRTSVVSGREHRYTIKATDAKGNETVLRGNFSCVGGRVSAPKATSRKVTGTGDKVIFSWKPVTSRRTITYEIALKGAGNKNYIYRRGFTTTKATVKFTSLKTWKWAVRAVDNYGYYSAWRWGKAFNNDRLAPTIRYRSSIFRKKSSGRTYVTIRWKSDEKATYTLVVNGKRVYRGKGMQRTVLLKDGYNICRLTAVDARGNRSVRNGRVFCDATAPTRPTGLRCELNNGGRGVAMYWNSSKDVSGVTYQFALKANGESKYSYYNTKDTSIGFSLTKNTSWRWAVRAVDSRGNKTAWVWGRNFTSYGVTAASASRAKASAKAVVSLDRELAVSAGATSLPAAAGSALAGGEATSSLLDNSGQQQEQYRTLLAAC